MSLEMTITPAYLGALTNILNVPNTVIAIQSVIYYAFKILNIKKILNQVFID